MSSEVRAMVDDNLFLKIDNKVLKENKKKAEVIRELLKKGFENENVDTIINQLLEISSGLEDLEETQNKMKKDIQKDRFILYQILYMICNYIDAEGEFDILKLVEKSVSQAEKKLKSNE